MTRSANWPDSSRLDACNHNFSSKIPFLNGEPLPTSTALVPAPESLISPSIAPSLTFYSCSPQKSMQITEDDVEICPAKLTTIKSKAYEKQEQAGENFEKSAFFS